MTPAYPPLRFGAVSFLNPVPLIWGMVHGPQKDQVDLSFSLPSVCSESFERGDLDVGLLPVAEIFRQGLQVVPTVGIACLGAVRSILLFSKVPWRDIKSLAVDSSSRTSVELAKLILRERFGVRPKVFQHAPHLTPMLEQADSALLIGDPALRVEPENQPYRWIDLGAEWVSLTGLPMVFAAWACKTNAHIEAVGEITTRSYDFGKSCLDEIISTEAKRRNFDLMLTDRYLRQHIRYELGSPELKGLQTFFSMAELSQLQIL